MVKVTMTNRFQTKLAFLSRRRLQLDHRPTARLVATRKFVSSQLTPLFTCIVTRAGDVADQNYKSHHCDAFKFCCNAICKANYS